MLLVSILDWPFSDSLSFINKFKYVKFELFDLYNNVYIEAWMENDLDDQVFVKNVKKKEKEKKRKGSHWNLVRNCYSWLIEAGF
jgi:hypothetical protein